MIGPGAFSSHIGILFKDTNDKPVFLHLAGHNSLLGDNPEEGKWGKFFWIQCNLHPVLLRVMAGICQHCNDHKPEIPYSIKYFGDYFLDMEGFEIARDAPGDGLSCATFVLEIFRKRGLEVLKLEDWPLFQDSELMDRIVGFLEQHTTADQNQIQALKSSLGTFPRFEPAQVAAGAIQSENNMPLGYVIASQMAENIEIQYR
jgi:hypothetical protein